MALISCPECQKNVSDRAAACPHCGLGNPGNPFKCSDCNTLAHEKDDACKNCGRPLRAPTEEIEIVPPKNQKPRLPIVSRFQNQVSDARHSHRSIKAASRAPAFPYSMIAFVVAFTAIAFVVLPILIPRADNGSWNVGDLIIMGNTVWPAIFTVLIGHVVGYAVWLLCAYSMRKRGS